jgi:hypothetical protein
MTRCLLLWHLLDFESLGVIPDGMTGLSLCYLQSLSGLCLCYFIYLLFLFLFLYIYTFCVYMCIFTARAVCSDIVQQIMPISYSSYCSLDTWAIVRLTATKFEYFMFLVLSFTFSYASNIHIIMILYDFCLFPAYFRYEIIYIRNLERHVKVTDRCVPR